MMRIMLYTLLLLLPLCANADEKAKALLDKAVAQVEASMPMTMTFHYEMYDDAGSLQMTDDGSVTISGRDKYNVSLSFMKIWCDGTRQWSYMAHTNEIYITSPDSEDGLRFSPLYMMQLYKNGYESTLTTSGNNNIVELKAIGPADIDMLKLTIDSATLQMKSAQLYMPEGRIDITVKAYDKKIKVADGNFICPLNEYTDAEIIDMVN